jgi:hypothetical protein
MEVGEQDQPSPLVENKKRKRGEGDQPDSSFKRTRVANPCQHCQRARRKCEETRPCSRCVSRGMEDSCTTENTGEPSSTSSGNAGSVKLEVAEELDTEKLLSVITGPVSDRNIKTLGVTLLPPELVRSELSKASNFAIPSNLKSIIDQFTSVWRDSKFSLSLGGVQYPFSPEQESYYSSLWLQPYTAGVLETAKMFAQEFSADFFAQFLLKYPLSWKWFLYCLEFVLGSSSCQVVHECLVQRILDEAALTPEERTHAMLLKKFDKFNAPSMTFVQTNDVGFSEEEIKILEAIFEVPDLMKSDVSMIRCTEFYDAVENSFKIVVEGNDFSSRTLGMSISEFGRTVWTGVGMFQIAPIFWSFDKYYWPRITKFLLGSAFGQFQRETDIVIFRNAKGESIPCLVHLFASYDIYSGARSAVSWCARPLSPKFHPPLTKFLFKKVNTFEKELPDVR